MADPFPHDDITTLESRRTIYRLSTLGTRLFEGEEWAPALAASALVLIAGCDNGDFDVNEVLDQVLDAYRQGDLAVTEEEVADIDEDLPFTH